MSPRNQPTLLPPPLTSQSLGPLTRSPLIFTCICLAPHNARPVSLCRPSVPLHPGAPLSLLAAPACTPLLAVATYSFGYTQLCVDCSTRKTCKRNTQVLGLKGAQCMGGKRGAAARQAGAAGENWSEAEGRAGRAPGDGGSVSRRVHSDWWEQAGARVPRIGCISRWGKERRVHETCGRGCGCARLVY